jgi:hypothetical protein
VNRPRHWRHHLAFAGEEAGDILTLVGEFRDLVGGERFGQLLCFFSAHSSILYTSFLIGCNRSALQSAIRDFDHMTCRLLEYSLSQGMKKFLQFVAVALVAVLTAQPALAGLTCGMTPLTGVPCAPKCDMAMHHMGANCPMHHHDTSSGCQQDCCRHGWPPALVQSASKTRLKTSGTPFLFAIPAPASAPAAAFAAAPPEDIVAAAPDRHVLLQVFRI